ncbi:MAG: methyltransferase domain-containing protein [Anaerolineales bacterium]|nr:methyltransferase domain-containing protein [Anaerolineales bacterium]
MIENTPPTKQIQRYYDQMGARYDWFEMYEGRAKARALTVLELTSGQVVLNVGVGTGKEHAHIQKNIQPSGLAIGLDVSEVMVSLAQGRSQAAMCQADARNLPFVDQRFDRLYSAYVLDLLPLADLPALLAGFHRVIKPGGLMVVLALTEGVNVPSRALVAVWKAAYAVSPVACGGCRPLQLSNLVQAAGFEQVRREVVVQMAVPSEIIVAKKPISE